MTLLTALLAASLALAHILAARLPAVADRHRRRWLSFAGGVAVAYVFIYILPELVEYQRIIRDSAPPFFAGRHIFLVALLGMCIYYGVERLAITFRTARASEDEGRVNQRIFWVHIGSFAVYNALVGYLLVREFQETTARAIFAVAIGMHFLVNDYALEQHHLDDYRRRGRWILSAAVLAGWALAASYQMPEPVIAVLFAFLAGGIVVNVMKEELPEERQGRFVAFLVGAAIYTALLLAMG